MFSHSSPSRSTPGCGRKLFGGQGPSASPPSPEIPPPSDNSLSTQLNVFECFEYVDQFETVELERRRDLLIDDLVDVEERQREIARKKEERKRATDRRNARKATLRRAMDDADLDLETGGGPLDMYVTSSGSAVKEMRVMFERCVKAGAVGLAMGALTFAAKYVVYLVT